MRDNRRILAGSWLLALFAVAFVACSSPAAAPDETESSAAESAFASPPGTIPSTEAEEYLGDKVTVCGPVVNTRNEKLITGAGRDAVLSTEISLDFDHPYPKQTFLVVIYPVDEENFDRGPEELLELYRDKEVCATGRIDFSFIGTFIRAYEQSQIEVME